MSDDFSFPQKAIVQCQSCRFHGSQNGADNAWAATRAPAYHETATRWIDLTRRQYFDLAYPRCTARKFAQHVRVVAMNLETFSGCSQYESMGPKNEPLSEKLKTCFGHLLLSGAKPTNEYVKSSVNVSQYTMKAQAQARYRPQPFVTAP